MGKTFLAFMNLETAYDTMIGRYVADAKSVFELQEIVENSTEFLC